MEAFQVSEVNIGLQSAERLRPEGYAVCVIGAGAAGVSAASHLARGGIAVTLLDRQAEVGGTVRTGFSPWSHREKFLHELRADVEESPFVRLITGVEVGKDVEL